MRDNTVMSGDGIEVYTHEIYRLADEYIDTELNNKDDIYDVSVFTGMILYISDNIHKPSNDDIGLLDSIFNIYIRLCTKYRILPTLEMFGMMINTDSGTFSDWAAGKYRLGSSHGQTVKKWKNICKNFLVNSLSNSKGTDANKIFIAKAAYGMVETAPALVQNQEQAQRSIEQIQQERAQRLPEVDAKSLPSADF